MLGGVNVIGLTGDRVLELAARAGLGAPTSTLPNDVSWGFGAAKYSRGGESSIYFWMSEGVVCSVQIQDTR